MNKKLKIGDKILWGRSETIYTIMDINLELTDQVLFQWETNFGTEQIRCYNYDDLNKKLNEGFLNVVDGINPIKRRVEFAFT
jgi:hypothetical protein